MAFSSTCSDPLLAMVGFHVSGTALASTGTMELQGHFLSFHCAQQLNQAAVKNTKVWSEQ